ncbi:50S ribosomal protein L10 [bacterium]|nr:50S ribosomal protein L10 [bacterium]
MPLNREQKSAEVQALSDLLARSRSLVVVDYKGLSVAKMTELRRRCRRRACRCASPRTRWSSARWRGRAWKVWPRSCPARPRSPSPSAIPPRPPAFSSSSPRTTSNSRSKAAPCRGRCWAWTASATWRRWARARKCSPRSWEASRRRRPTSP